MKKALLIILTIFLCTTIVKAQVQLQQQIPNYVYPFNTSQDGTWYVEVLNHPVLSVYRSDFTLYKDMPVPIPEQFYSAYIFFISDKLFNLDDKLEYVLYRYSVSNTMEGLLVNEDGDILYDFGQVDESMFPFITQSPGKSPVMGIYVSDQQLQSLSTHIYTLPGNYLPIKEKEGFDKIEYPRPNPSHDLIEIPYNISGSTEPLLTIYNSSGSEIQKGLLDKNEKRLILNISTFPSGTYIYKIGDQSGKFIVN